MSFPTKPTSRQGKRRRQLLRRLQQLTLGGALLVLVLSTIWYHEQNYNLPMADYSMILDAPHSNGTLVVSSHNIENNMMDSMSVHNPPSEHRDNLPPHPLYYIIPTPELTTWITGNYSREASMIYAEALNEARAEIWLHRAFVEMDVLSAFRTFDPDKAHVFVITGYFHLRERLQKQKILRPEHVLLQKNAWIDDFLAHRCCAVDKKHRPHLMLVPTWNPTVSRKIGLHPLMKAMVRRGYNVWSVGYERNPAWQSTPSSRIIPIPYVVEPPWRKADIVTKTTNMPRKENVVFYAGDSRPNAIEWAGCHRVRMLSPLVNNNNSNNNQTSKNLDIRIVTKHNRLSQTEYNDRMATSDYCLILCGDTPSSRSLTSAMVFGCIPVRIGSRLRGLCEPPCKVGFGFRKTGSDFPHLPYSHAIDWDSFPELNEAEFIQNPMETLQAMLHRIGPEDKKRLRAIMRNVQLGWIYGWGDPVQSTEFGNAATYIWESFVDALRRHHHSANRSKQEADEFSTGSIS